MCQDYVSCIVNFLVDCTADETANDDEGVMTPSKLVKALHVFCEVQPSLLKGHLSTLQPYLLDGTAAMPIAVKGPAKTKKEIL